MITAAEFIKKVTYESQSDAQIDIVERQINDALLEAIASSEMPTTITIKGFKKSQLTLRAKSFIVSKGYKSAKHLVGQNPETLTLIL